MISFRPRARRFSSRTAAAGCGRRTADTGSPVVSWSSRPPLASSGCQERAHVEAVRRPYRLENVALIGTRRITRGRVEVTARTLQPLVCELENGVQGIGRVRANDDADLTTAGPHDRPQRKERDRIDERLHERSIELLAGQPREHQAGA